MNALIPALYLAMAALDLSLASQHPHDGSGFLWFVAACVFLAAGLNTLRRYWRHV